jgi:hypothetical protein
VVLACLLIGGPAIAAAAGVFQTGSPVGPNVPLTPRADAGVAINGTVHVLPLRVQDPAGGPPWGLRMLRTTRGLACLQVGRIVNGRIGALGQDGLFNDDGRLHPFSANLVEFGGSSCSTLDAHGHGFFAATWQALPAAGLDIGCAPFANERIGRYEPCPPRDLRNIYWGLLGPDAASITYRMPSGQPAVEKTSGPDGAYLIVGPPTREICRLIGPPSFPDRFRVCGNGGTATTALKAGEVLSVAYRGHAPCRLPPPTPRGALDVSCPLVGYVPSSTARPTHSELATQIHLRLERDSQQAPILAVTFTARVAVTNSDAFYTVHYGSPSCPGPSSTALTSTDLHAGQTVHETFPLLCAGVQHVIVEYYPANVSTLGTPAVRASNGKAGILVGTASLTAP